MVHVQLNLRRLRSEFNAFKARKIILKLLGELNGESNPEEIANTSNLPEVAVMRTLLTCLVRI